jgi:hypothetical protein
MSIKMYIRVKKDGFIYDYNEMLARNAGCEVITEQQAFPERAIDDGVAERIQKKRASKKPALDLATDIPEEPVYTNPDLSEEAGRGWPE